MECSNQNVLAWIKSASEYLKPKDIQWIDGSAQQYRAICDLLVERGTFTRLNETTHPGSFWCRSNPNDVARVEDRTFICSAKSEDAGPTNNWRDPNEMRSFLRDIMTGCMQSRTMYVIPYLMGPDGSPFSKVGFELTDSPYVVANMYIMARVGAVALKNLRDSTNEFVRGIHSVGSVDPEKRFICHFPDQMEITSFNSDYGGNALQGKKCFALRIASTLARSQGWLAEHMLILGITNPQGKKHYVTAAFPSACGKTNLAMLIPPKIYQDRGWKVETVGDDIAWLNFGNDGRLYAINPEAGFFGVAPGTSLKTNPNAINTVQSNTIFTNTALDLNSMSPWWEGLSEPPKHLRDWLGNDWDPESGTKAAHPNSRFTTPARQCPSIDPAWESPQGVPISAMIFGGRRARTAPLVYEAMSWQHGVYVGATMASETTAAAAGAVGKLRRDPMAMHPFIGYHVGDYFSHWLAIGKRAGAVLPRIFHVNWFRQGEKGEFLWPGFGDNLRVLEWITQRVDGTADAVKTPLGFQPAPQQINNEGLSLNLDAIRQTLAINPDDWRDELTSQIEFFDLIGSKLPRELRDENDALRKRLGL